MGFFLFPDPSSLKDTDADLIHRKELFRTLKGQFKTDYS